MHHTVQPSFVSYTLNVSRQIVQSFRIPQISRNICNRKYEHHENERENENENESKRERENEKKRVKRREGGRENNVEEPLCAQPADSSSPDPSSDSLVNFAKIAGGE